MTKKTDATVTRMRDLLARTVDDEDPLSALAAARDLRLILYEWEGVLARKGVAEGASWDAVGTLLGVSRQAAWTRYREPSETTPAIREARERVAKARERTSRG